MSARPRTVAPAAAALALGALLAACGSPARTTPAAPVGSTTEVVSTVAATPAPPVSTKPAVATADASASTSAARPPATRPATPRALPFVADPWKRGYEFGFVRGAERSGDTVTLTFDRAGMLLGAQAEAYYDAHTAEERLDHKILNDEGFSGTLTVPASATLYGNQRLGARNGSQNQRIDLARLVAGVSGSAEVAVWVQRTGNGPVTYLAEQYLP